VSSACGSFSFPAHPDSVEAISRSRNMKKPMSHSRSSVNTCQRPRGITANVALVPQPKRAWRAPCSKPLCKTAALSLTRIRPHTACMGTCGPIPPLLLETARPLPRRVASHRGGVEPARVRVLLSVWLDSVKWDVFLPTPIFRIKSNRRMRLMAIRPSRLNADEDSGVPTVVCSASQFHLASKAHQTTQA